MNKSKSKESQICDSVPSQAEAAALADLPQGRPGKSKGQICTFPTQDEAAVLLNVSKRSVKSARRVKADGVPELAAAVVAGDVAVSAAAEVAKLPKEEQRAVVAKGKKAVATRAKEERAKAPPPSSPPLEWDERDFLWEVRAQVDDQHRGPAQRWIFATCSATAFRRRSSRK